MEPGLNSTARSRSLGKTSVNRHRVVMKKPKARGVRVAKLKARLSAYLRKVRDGETITVLDRDTPIARLVPLGSGAPLSVRAAQPMPVALGTLEAVHLATVLLWRETRDDSLMLATHGRALALGARASGLHVIGV